jgi:hypothetical protein
MAGRFAGSDPPGLGQLQNRRNTVTKLKMLAVFAAVLSALIVSTASASAAVYKTTAGKAVGANHVFAVTGGEVTCEESVYTYPTGSSKTLAVAPSFTKCKVTAGTFKGVGATVGVNSGCHFVFGEPVGAEPTFSATTEIEAGCKIVITVKFLATCEVKVEGKQGPLTKVVAEDKGASEAEIKAEVGGITYGVNTACEVGGITAGKAGKYKGSLVAKGVHIG